MELNTPIEINVIKLTNKQQTTLGMSHILEGMDIIEILH